ncbi:MAG: UvrD-helicase domain-containing protein, partial [Planctomycetota bacterium]
MSSKQSLSERALAGAYSGVRDAAPAGAPLAYLETLNEAQREAVLATDGPVLMLAGAGTGKTRALTTRIAHLLNRRLAWPSQILAVTFTNKAAREMKERVAALIGGEAEGMRWLGTFHAIANRLLREFAANAGLDPSFTVLDRGDAADLMDLVRHEQGLAA